MKNRHINASSIRVKQLTKLLMFVYIAIIIIFAAIISFLTIKKTDTALKSKVSSMASALNVQMKMNLDSYLERMETIGTLVFASEEICEYNAADEGNDDYEAIKTEQIIADHLYNICIMENFVDFSIVYPNNSHVGKMSNGTVKLFGDNLYNDLVSMINRPKTADGWSTGYMGNFKRIYYVKRVNENAVLVMSFYTTELSEVFEHPGGIEDITVQLIEENNVVIYSSDEVETGSVLASDIAVRINGRSSVTIVDDKYLITLTDCGDNWRVVCSAPADIILREKNEVTWYIVITAIVASLFAAAISIIIMNQIIEPVNEIVDLLADEAHLDLLTGIFNKRTFEKKVEETLRNTDKQKKKALILIDLDNFKGVNDTLGHAYGDKVLANVGDILRLVFHTDDYLGRLGGDEFCVYLNITEVQQGNYRRHIEEKCEELCSMFHNNYTGENNNYKISASIGAAIFPDHGDAFSDLYKFADNALYESKHKGKDTYTIYEQKEESI